MPAQVVKLFLCILYKCCSIDPYEDVVNSLSVHRKHVRPAFGSVASVHGTNFFSSSTTDLSSLLTNERLNAALRDVAQLEVNKAVMLSRLDALEHTLQSSPATPSAVLMRPSLSTYSASSSTPAKGAVGDSNEVAALSGTQPHTPKTDLVALRIEPAKVAQQGETRLNTAALVFKPPPAMVNKCCQTPACWSNDYYPSAYNSHRNSNNLLACASVCSACLLRELKRLKLVNIKRRQLLRQIFLRHIRRSS